MPTFMSLREEEPSVPAAPNRLMITLVWYRMLDNICRGADKASPHCSAFQTAGRCSKQLQAARHGWPTAPVHSNPPGPDH